MRPASPTHKTSPEPPTTQLGSFRLPGALWPRALSLQRQSIRPCDHRMMRTPNLLLNRRTSSMSRSPSQALCRRVKLSILVCRSPIKTHVAISRGRPKGRNGHGRGARASKLSGHSSSSANTSSVLIIIARTWPPTSSTSANLCPRPVHSTD
jgi:hypothetical protein